MALSYHNGPRGVIGTLTQITEPSGAVRAGVIPAFSLADSTGAAAPAGSSADPSFSNATVTPSGTSGTGLTRVATTAVASSLVVKASAGNLYGYNIVTGATAGYLMIFDAVSAPADGTVTPKLCLPVAANAGIQADRDIALRFTTGITMVFSSTGPFTKTASATAFLAGDAV